MAKRNTGTREENATVKKSWVFDGPSKYFQVAPDAPFVERGGTVELTEDQRANMQLHGSILLTEAEYDDKHNPIKDAPAAPPELPVLGQNGEIVAGGTDTP